MAKNLPKLEIPYNQDVRVKLTKDRPYTSSNEHGPYFLYTLLDLQSNETKALFADVSVHEAIEGKKLGAGSEIIIRKTPMQEGTKILPRFELTVVNAVARNENGNQKKEDNLKELLSTSIRDVVDIVKDCGVQFSNDEMQKLASTLFIQRSRSK